MLNDSVFVGLALFGVAGLVLWIHAFRTLGRDDTLSAGAKTVWFVVVLLGPIVGSIAYLSARKNIRIQSAPDATRMYRLLGAERRSTEPPHPPQSG